MKRRYASVFGCLLLFVILPRWADAGVLYTQSVTGGSLWTSDTFGPGQGFRTYDDFVLSKNSVINEVRWLAIPFFFRNAANNPAPYDATDWTIGIFEDQGGPGALVYEEKLPVIPVENTRFAFNTTVGGRPTQAYTHRFFLSNDVFVQNNTRYWLSVMAHSPTEDPIFLWNAGVGPNGSSFQESLFSGAGRFVNGDRSFQLRGEIVPEPTSLAIFGMGALGMVGMSTRRKKKRVE